MLNLYHGLDGPSTTEEERRAAFFRGPELAALPGAPGPTRAVPIVEAPVAAGPPLSASEARESLEVPVDLLKRLLGWDAHQIQNGATYVCVPPGDDGGTTKRVFLTEDHLILWPDNEAYSPVQVPLEQLKHEDRWVSHVVRALVVTIMNPAAPAQPAARTGKRRK